jgi:hypothetical protein
LITYVISPRLCSGVDGVEWKAFFTVLLEKIGAQIGHDVSASASATAVEAAYVIARSGGEAGGAVVLQKLAPLLLQATESAHAQQQQALRRAVVETAAGNGVANVSGRATGKGRQNPATAEGEGWTAPMEMLAQLIACVSERPAHTCNSAGACSGHLHRPTPPSPAVLTPHTLDMFHTLRRFVEPAVVDPTVSDNAATGAVNPFLAVKAAFSEDASRDDAGSRAPVLVVPETTADAVVAALSALRELLQR